ncbi:unnamed protein product [Symbiodinium necroappetens]|uniref:Uncharacterized protein n=1 Tax=Symbiodinium necroappetens TaxID=1628268 RepID=A0A812RZY6_9DINO|nr:unnamed protein product [Symbiodinium necroappetens]
MSVEQVRKLLQDESVRNELFRQLEAEPFAADEVRRLYPHLHDRWLQIGAAIQVPWQYVMIMELALAAALSPTAVLLALPTLRIYPVVWWFLFHPGATNTSVVVRLYADVLDLLEMDVNNTRRDMAKSWQEENPGRDGRNPFGGEVSMTSGSGSLEGEGKLMAMSQNLGRSVSFMTEGKRLLKWLQNEGSVNESIVVELWERMKWKRATVHADRTFTVMCPFFLAAGALHVEDPLDLYVLNDPLGVRGRLGLFYARPTFKRAAEVEQAAASITTARFGLETNIAGVFKAVMKAHDPVHSASPAHFEQFKGYPFRIYGLSDEAKQAFHGVFDERTKAHEEAHLVDMGKAKFHSKAKTKFLRHSLVVHICEQARLGSTPQAWAGELPVAALRFGQLLSDYMDRVDGIFASFVTDLIGRLDLAATNPGGRPGCGSQGRASMRQQLQQLLQLPQTSFRELAPATAVVLLKLCRALLRKPGAWLDSAAVLKSSDVKEILNAIPLAEQLHHYARAVRLLKLCKLVEMGLGTNAHGTPLIFAVKRVMPASTEPAYVYYANVLSAFGLRFGGHHSEYRATNHLGPDIAKPPAAPELALDPALTQEESAAICAVLQSLAAHSSNAD